MTIPIIPIKVPLQHQECGMMRLFNERSAPSRPALRRHGLASLYKHLTQVFVPILFCFAWWPSLVQVILANWISKLLGFWSSILLRLLNQHVLLFTIMFRIKIIICRVYPIFRHIHILHCFWHLPYYFFFLCQGKITCITSLQNQLESFANRLTLANHIFSHIKIGNPLHVTWLI